jgi:hypothetical protein
MAINTNHRIAETTNNALSVDPRFRDGAPTLAVSPDVRARYQAVSTPVSIDEAWARVLADLAAKGGVYDYIAENFLNEVSPDVPAQQIEEAYWPAVGDLKVKLYVPDEEDDPAKYYFFSAPLRFQIDGRVEDGAVANFLVDRQSGKIEVTVDD